MDRRLIAMFRRAAQAEFRREVAAAIIDLAVVAAASLFMRALFSRATSERVVCVPSGFG
jgi:hypothetical protein